MAPGYTHQRNHRPSGRKPQQSPACEVSLVRRGSGGDPTAVRFSVGSAPAPSPGETPKGIGMGQDQARMSRRGMLKIAGATGLGAIAAGHVFEEGNNPNTAVPPAPTTTYLTPTTKLEGTLSILQLSHYVPRYDKWFDACAKEWGRRVGVDVAVDHVVPESLVARTTAEIAADSGHDLIEWVSPPSQLEPDVVDLSDLHDEAVKRFGLEQPFCKRAGYNPSSRKYYGYSHAWAARPGRLPQEPVAPGGAGRRAVDLGGAARGRQGDQTEVQRRRGDRHVERAGLQHGGPGAHVVVRRIGAERDRAGGARLPRDDRRRHLPGAAIHGAPDRTYRPVASAPYVLSRNAIAQGYGLMPRRSPAPPTAHG